MDIILTKDFKDTRKNRSKTLKKDTEMTVTNELGKQWIKEKKAKVYEPPFQVIKRKPIRSVDEAERYTEESQQETEN